MWVVREGTKRGAGRYVWQHEVRRDFGGALGTARGGDWEPFPPKVNIWWEPDQSGAERFHAREIAARLAKRVGGRVVALMKSSEGDR